MLSRWIHLCSRTLTPVQLCLHGLTVLFRLLVQPIQKDEGPTRVVVVNNCSCSSTESPSITWPTCETTNQENHVPSLHVHEVMPDFAQVYSFLGTVFDPNTSSHLQKLKEMNPIDVETELLLMKNLSINLTRPEFEPHVTLIMPG